MTKLSKSKSQYMFSSNIKFLQKAVVFDKLGKKFLSIKRSPHAFSRAGTWDLPGGCVSFGENHEASLRREIKEETGLSVKKLKLIEVTTSYDKKNKIYTLFIGYSTKILSGKIILSCEHTDYKWVTSKEFTSASFLKNLVKLSHSK